MGKGVSKAVGNINNTLAPALIQKVWDVFVVKVKYFLNSTNRFVTLGIGRYQAGRDRQISHRVRWHRK